MTSPITSPRARPAERYLLLAGQPVEIGGDQPLRAPGLAAHPDLDQLRHQHGEADAAVGDALLGHLDRSDIAGLAEQGRGAVPDLADRRDVEFLALERGPGGAELLGRQPAQVVEGDVLQGEADVLIFGPVERAGRAFDAALDAEPGAGRLDRRWRWPVDLLAGRSGGRLGQGRGRNDGRADGERDSDSTRRRLPPRFGRRTLTHHPQALLTVWPKQGP